jgi:hypothetical protein
MSEVQQFEAKAFDAEIGMLRERVKGLIAEREENRRKLDRLITKLNDYIDSNDCEEDGDIGLSELDDMLYEVYKKRLVFDKVFEVQITYTLDATFEVKAKNEDEAREIADEIGICTDPVFDYEDDPTECAINESRVGYLQRKVD